MSQLHQVADEVIVVETPEPFNAVGEWYLDFDHTSDQNMVNLLIESRRHWNRSLAEVGVNDRSDLVDPVDPVDMVDPVDRPVWGTRTSPSAPRWVLTGYLTVPEDAKTLYPRPRPR